MLNSDKYKKIMINNINYSTITFESIRCLVDYIIDNVKVFDRFNLDYLFDSIDNEVNDVDNMWEIMKYFQNPNAANWSFAFSNFCDLIVPIYIDICNYILKNEVNA